MFICVAWFPPVQDVCASGEQWPGLEPPSPVSQWPSLMPGLPSAIKLFNLDFVLFSSCLDVSPISGFYENWVPLFLIYFGHNTVANLVHFKQLFRNDLLSY